MSACDTNAVPSPEAVKAARDEIVWALIDEWDMLGSHGLSA